MLAEITSHELAAALEDCAANLLWEAGIIRPPVHARHVAEQLGLIVATAPCAAHRARFMRLAAPAAGCRGRELIVVGPSERPERDHWAVAHEIGESVAGRVFDRLGIRPDAASPAARELVANRLAGCLLLPRFWFEVDGRELDWDLFSLKARYATASHELIARRMLELRPPIVVTVCDLGRTSWRRSNVARHVPRLLPAERGAWARSHTSGLPYSATLDPGATGLERIRCWPIHEPDWKREIILSQIADSAGDFES
ncbi:MAG TPA: ImmA/IrrE family metallo-endopeptidase [Dongiaceae bacterium]